MPWYICPECLEHFRAPVGGHSPCPVCDADVPSTATCVDIESADEMPIKPGAPERSKPNGIRVYIASPYTIGNKEANVKRAIDCWHELYFAGYTPFCPLLTHYLEVHSPYHLPLNHQEWLDYDYEWLSQCNALIRLPGPSIGADAEVEFARTHGIPVVETLAGLQSCQEKEDILSEALRITKHERNSAYGPPEQDFARTAAIWSALLGVDVTPAQVALCMIGLKLSRATWSHKRDNWVDIAGYARCGFLCESSSR